MKSNYTKAEAVRGLLIAAMLGAGAMPLAAAPADSDGNSAPPVVLHGSVQGEAAVLQDGKGITLTTDEQDNRFRLNSYADLTAISRYVDAGIRLEYMQHPLPGFEPDFAGWGVPNLYVKGKLKGAELTLGSFYEQFGSGYILRLYEDRPIGIDNSLMGARVKYNGINGLRLTALGGLQRRYWDWYKAWDKAKSSQVYGASAEYDVTTVAKCMADAGYNWTVGASYVLRHEGDETVMIPATDYRLNLPRNVGAFDVLTRLQKGAVGLEGEFAMKSQDPSADNHYTYGYGQAAMLGATYARKGLSAMLQARRSENMSYRSRRSMAGTSAMLNNMPAFAYQHTYALPSMYPYATQPTAGEWSFQAAVAYTFPRKTPLGGKYGTKVKVNASYIRGLDYTGFSGVNKLGITPYTKSEMGSDGPASKWFGMGPQYYHDINIQIDKRLTSDLHLDLMYMNQYNYEVTSGTKQEDGNVYHGKVRANIFVADMKYKVSKKMSLRTELQYLSTKEDTGDWAYGMVEMAIAPHLMFSVSDMWNCGAKGDIVKHYYMVGGAYNYKSVRFTLSYGRTRAGFNCSGGVCRMVPASYGLRAGLSWNF